MYNNIERSIYEQERAKWRGDRNNREIGGEIVGFEYWRCESGSYIMRRVWEPLWEVDG